MFLFFFSSRRRHTRFDCDWSSDVCSSDLDDQTGVFGKLSRVGARNLSAESLLRTHPAGVAGATGQGADRLVAAEWAETLRSEERRVGKECRSRWSREH